MYQSRPASDNPIGVEVRLDDQIENYHKTHYFPIPFATIIMAIEGADPKERTVTATIKANFNHDYLFVGNPPELVDAKGRAINSLDSQFAHSALTLTLYCYPSGEVVANFPLSGIRQFQDQSTTVNIPVEATPQSFPHDRYNLKIIDAYLTTPEGTWLRYQYKTAKGKQVRRTTEWPIGLGIAWGDRLVDWRLKPSLSTSVSKASYGTYGVNVRSQLVRPLGLILFVYSIALAPALLGFSYLLRTRRKGDGEDGISPLELGAAFIALLTLRQVLIPSDIPGITLLDRFLGIEIVVLVAIAVATLSRRSRPLDASTGSPSQPETADGSPSQPETADGSPSQPETADASSRHPVIIMFVFVATLWRWFKRLKR